MISGLQNSLASVFRKALRFLGMANASTNDLPPFETMDTSGDSVQRYVSNLLNGYNAHGSARMDEYTVAELCHCKEETNVGHEYVTAKVVGPIPPFYLIFERFRGDENKDEPTTNTQEELGADARGERERLARRGILQTSSEVIRTSSDTSKEAFNIVKGSLSPWIISRNAIDRVSVSTGRTRPAKPPHFPSHVAHIATFADPIQLYKVAVLAVTIHHFADKYNVQYANCYFYAEVIMQVMKRLHHAEISTKSHPSWTPTGRLPIAKITPFPKVYNSLPTEEQICEIINSYRSELKDFEHRVCSITCLRISSDLTCLGSDQG